MLSAEDFAVAKVAIELCNNFKLKLEILCAPGSEYSLRRNRTCQCKEEWDKIIKRKVQVMLENLSLSQPLQTKITSVILSIGMRMLIWAKYHERILGLSQQYSIHFLNSSFFTQQGIIDDKKAAIELMKDENLSLKQRYKLSCLYCITEHIPVLHRQMKICHKEAFYDAEIIKQPELVRFWSYYLLGEIDKLNAGRDLDEYLLAKAVESGNKAAVEYCLEETNLKRKEDAVIDAAEETVRNKVIRGLYASFTSESIESDWVVFRDHVSKDSVKSWIPNDYYVDILCFVLSKMKESQLIQFLKRDIEGRKYKRYFLMSHRHSRVLQYMLNWPYQNYFMRIANLMWEFLPERSYVDLLLEISEKIDPVGRSLKHGEEKYFDYRKLLKEFWCKSPEHFKRYVLRGNEITHENGDQEEMNEGYLLLYRLFVANNFTHEDRRNVEVILEDATAKEKETIIYSQTGKEICVGLMRREKWEILDMFILNCLLSIGPVEVFRREFVFTEAAQQVCIDFVKKDNNDAAEWFINWSSLAEEEANRLKKEMIYSEYGKEVCVSSILYYGNTEFVDRLIRWFLPSEEKVTAFKKELLLLIQGSN